MALPRVFKSTLTSRANLYKAEEGRSSRGNKSSKSGVLSQYNAGGVMYLKDDDEDMDALSPSWASASPGASVEMQTPTYNVSVTGGHGKGGVPAGELGGIQTTTVVTQRVDSL